MGGGLQQLLHLSSYQVKLAMMALLPLRRTLPFKCLNGIPSLASLVEAQSGVGQVDPAEDA